MLKRSDLYDIQKSINEELKLFKITLSVELLKDNTFGVYLINKNTGADLFCYYSKNKRMIYDALNRSFDLLQILRDDLNEMKTDLNVALYYKIRKIISVSADHNYH